MIIMNYTGDRINFGIAVEKAKAEGLLVEMVVVADDCALPKDKGITGRRGVAGTIFVHKVAGAAAAAGCSLAEVRAEAQNALENVGSLGVALNTCTLPGQPKSDRAAELDGDVAEVGLGIHGEAGMKKVSPCPSADELVVEMLSAITVSAADGGQGFLPLEEGSNVALLINNLGSVPEMEMNILTRKAIMALETAGALAGVPAVHVARVWTGSFMTSLDMNGASISVLRMSDAFADRLDTPASASGWKSGLVRPKGFQSAQVLCVAPAAAQHQPEEPSAQGLLLGGAVAAAMHAILALESKLTEWDQIAGDGDCGITARRGAEAILGAQVPYNNPKAALEAMAEHVGNSMGGTSGGLYQIALTAAAAKLSPNGALAEEMPAAFCAAVESIKFYGGADEGYRTMLDALMPAARAFEQGQTLAEAAAAAEAGADLTANMTALAGRSNYINEETLNGTPDPGAKAVAAMMTAVAQSH